MSKNTNNKKCKYCDYVTTVENKESAIQILEAHYFYSHDLTIDQISKESKA